MTLRQDLAVHEFSCFCTWTAAPDFEFLFVYFQAELRQFPDLLSRFILFAKEKGETLTNTYLRDLTINFVIAGRDTTAWYAPISISFSSFRERYFSVIASAHHEAC